MDLNHETFTCESHLGSVGHMYFYLVYLLLIIGKILNNQRCEGSKIPPIS